VLRGSVAIRRRVPLRRLTPLITRRTRPRRGPPRSLAYLAWIRTLGCAVCRRPPGGVVASEAAHTNVLGPRGLRQKTSDYSAIPLCFRHHRGDCDSYHHLGEQRFAQTHQLNLRELVMALNHRYCRRGPRLSALYFEDFHD